MVSVICLVIVHWVAHDMGSVIVAVLGPDKQSVMWSVRGQSWNRSLFVLGQLENTFDGWMVCL